MTPDAPRPDLDEAVRLLGEVYTDEGVHIWLRAPNRRFGSRTPLELIETGQGAQVLRVARQLAEGSF